ncbi:hypothetical protein [uncultured Croceitalea sp.]|uniref:hypothetical protein n=1 Tax=uncultured Croceitalea sp. TaxID=1798908 RepID=UPI0033057219
MKFPTLLFLSSLAVGLKLVAQENQLNKILENLKVELVQPETISTKDFEFGTSVSPDGNEFFFVKGLPRFGRTVIVYCKWKDASWSPPLVAQFSGKYNDTNPYFSKDGKRLYFTSDRPSQNPNIQGRNFWYVERTTHGWSEPKVVPGSINDQYDIVYPTIQLDRTVHFVSWNRPDSQNGDIYVSKFKNGTYTSPELVEELNTTSSDADPELSNDGQLMFLTSTREGGLGHYDLYVFKKKTNGKWGKAINLGNQVNSNRMDSDPILSPDGQTLYFSSDRLAYPDVSKQTYANYGDIRSFYNQILNGAMNIYKVDISELLSFLKETDF